MSNVFWLKTSKLTSGMRKILGDGFLREKGRGTALASAYSFLSYLLTRMNNRCVVLKPVSEANQALEVSYAELLDLSQRRYSVYSEEDHGDACRRTSSSHCSTNK